jgi:methenyltetrahydrofolate cyclohydrolase
LTAVAAKSPTPGGGAVAGAVGALASALAGMVVAYSAGKKSLAEHEPALRGAQSTLANARGLFLRLAEEDAAAYGAVNELSRLPEADPRRAGLPAATEASVRVPAAMIAACVDLLRLMERLAPISNRHLASDLAIAAVLAEATARAARWNVVANAGLLPDGAERSASLADAERSVGEAAARRGRVEAACV